MSKVVHWIKQKLRLAPVMAQDSMAHRCLIGGEDRKTSDEILQSTGEFILNENNELAFDVNPNTVRVLVKYGERKFAAPHSILYETCSAPFNFVTQSFETDESSTAQILADGRAHAQTQAVTYIEKEEQQNRMGLALTILAAGFAIMGIIMVV